MAKQTFLATRLNPKKDKDIIADLERFKDKSKRLREVYRIAMKVEAGEFIKSLKEKPVYTPKKLNWHSFEDKTPVKPSAGQAVDKRIIKANIKKGF